MKRNATPPASTNVIRLEYFPKVGVSVAGDLRQLVITTPGDLPGRDDGPDAVV